MTGAETRDPTLIPADQRRRVGWEVVAVLGVTFLSDGISALLSFIRNEINSSGRLSSLQTTVVSGGTNEHPVLDFFDNLYGLVHGIFPVVLALALLAATPGGPGFGIGIDRSRIRRESLQGVGFLALIGIPGLGLVYAAHELNLNVSLQVVSFPDVWYRVPYLLLSAAQNGLAEEFVVLAYLLTRLRQLGWSDQRALAASAVLRGSYHLYQGIGGFVGNLVMGLIFGWVFQRTRRVWPMAIAHFLLDAFSFVGYLYLSSRISWI